MSDNAQEAAGETGQLAPGSIQAAASRKYALETPLGRALRRAEGSLLIRVR
ncbi:MAG TPA: hypothetical protein VIK15_05885 [Candidatus Anoxymicrobiaceae bacterium]